MTAPTSGLCALTFSLAPAMGMNQMDSHGEKTLQAAALRPVLSSICTMRFPCALRPVASPKIYGHLVCELRWFLEPISCADRKCFPNWFPMELWWFSISCCLNGCSFSGRLPNLQKYVQICFAVLISPCLNTKNAFRQPLKVIQITGIEMENSKMMNIV